LPLFKYSSYLTFILLTNMNSCSFLWVISSSTCSIYLAWNISLHSKNAIQCWRQQLMMYYCLTYWTISVGILNNSFANAFITLSFLTLLSVLIRYLRRIHLVLKTSSFANRLTKKFLNFPQMCLIILPVFDIWEKANFIRWLKWISFMNVWIIWKASISGVGKSSWLWSIQRIF
jgi:hypothetical protein